ncbi:MAG TPA: hypothetical protein VIY69_01980, partial [Candidatus Acidoferrales bacterium]
PRLPLPSDGAAAGWAVTPGTTAGGAGATVNVQAPETSPLDCARDWLTVKKIGSAKRIAPARHLVARFIDRLLKVATPKDTIDRAITQ